MGLAVEATNGAVVFEVDIEMQAIGINTSVINKPIDVS